MIKRNNLNHKGIRKLIKTNCTGGLRGGGTPFEINFFKIGKTCRKRMSNQFLLLFIVIYLSYNVSIITRIAHLKCLKKHLKTPRLPTALPPFNKSWIHHWIELINLLVGAQGAKLPEAHGFYQILSKFPGKDIMLHPFYLANT